MKKLYARLLKASYPADPELLAASLPIIQGEVVPYAMSDPGARQIFFFLDEQDGTMFSITLYDTEKDLEHAMRDADSEHRYSTLARLGYTPVDARALEVVAGEVAGDVAEVDFTQGNS
ncbi:hypothetical protein GPX89_29975 [Nocardia sp. ET3-3]|uniref:Uncharacterized protein n=1 Tax=Nocardia terrae TaxID=2675851 RepID=A0A7K1V4B6_9NOCA|nr:hypothetical protein [Nocardia terrae]MVU81456.1 hypothetical protein [Nocardia terrae]